MDPSRRTLDGILLAVAGPRVTPARQARLAGLLAGAPDWAALLDHADEHGLLPLLHHHVRALPEGTVPADRHAELADRARERVVWTLAIHEETLGALAVLERADVPAMPLKGTYLGELLYGDCTLRPTSDVDLLVRPEDASAAERALLEAGYARDEEPGTEADYYNRKLVVERAGAAVLLELHLELGPSYVSQVPLDSLWRSATRTAWHGRTIWTMAPGDLLLTLCVGAVRDGLASLRAVLDVALALERLGDAWPWAELAARARAAGIRTPAWLCLTACRDLLGTPVPPALLAALRPASRPDHWLARRLAAWRGGILHTPARLTWLPLQFVVLLLLEETARGKRRCLRRLLVPPPGVRARWTPGARASPLSWYPAWVLAAARTAVRQATGRMPQG